MKNFRKSRVWVAAVALSAVASFEGVAAEKPLKLLTVGNSFSVSLATDLPGVAKSLGRDLDFCSLYIGGCSLERHWSNVTAATNAAFRPYAMLRYRNGEKVASGKINLPEALRMDRWDVVTVQQASHQSWRPETYRPFGDNLVAEIRRLAPQAKILVQETWSYTPHDRRLRQWGLDQDSMYVALNLAYRDFARRHGLDVIPMGRAVQDWRRENNVVYMPDAFGEDVCGGRRGSSDPFHLNERGEYLQALVWAAYLFDADVTKCEYRSDRVDAATAHKLKTVALAAVRREREREKKVGGGEGGGEGEEWKVDFGKTNGVIKPVNGVGQPPIRGWCDYRMFHYLTEAGIPFSRLHDTGGAFGKGIYVDIPNLFRDFEADEDDPNSYDFAFTDELLKALVAAKVEPYFRLGVTIENAQKVKVYRIRPPKDFAKWARICEHVVRHYTEGWANGFRFDISHWEIWNEPDSFETLETNLMWKDTFDRYCDLYVIAAKHLKEKFPHLKVGGYASCGFYGVASAWASPKNPRIPHLMNCFSNFLGRVRSAGAPLDFFSYHCYDRPAQAERQVAYCRRTLDDFGFAKTETSLNEWLPCHGGAKLAEIDTARQASQIAAMLAIMQNGPVDDAEIYDARTTGGSYSPFFAPDTGNLRKAYYAYLAFNELRKLGRAVQTPKLPEGLWACAATDGNGRAAVMLANASTEAIALSPQFGAFRVVRSRVIDELSNLEDGKPGGAIGAESVWLLELAK